jgi:hypothetical protein
MCLGSAFAVSERIERPVLHKSVVELTATDSVPANADAKGAHLRFASPATLVLGAIGFLAMLKKPTE